VTDLLGGLKGPTGDPVFRAVLPRQEAYPGGNGERAPDLLLVPADESVLPVTSLTGELWTPSPQTGLHRYEGIWAQRSPRVRPGRLPGTIPLTDAMPTLLTDLGAAWPQDVDGRPRTEVFTEDVPVPGPARHLDRPDAVRSAAGPADAPEEPGEDDYTSSRLREMGYL
jgi:predicted AlkP superfamily phosphohydrolase/phosphomutase